MRPTPPAPICILAALLLTAVPLTAQSTRASTGTLVGTVVSRLTGAPLPDATVHLVGAARRVATDARGGFYLRDVQAGTAVLRVERLGYAELTREVEVGVGQRVEVALELEQEAIGIDPLVVLLERTRMIGDPLNLGEVPGAAHFLTRQDLLAQRIAFDDVQQALRRIPGVNVVDEEGYGLRPNIGLRGTGTERSSKITLMEDGVLAAPAPYAAPAAYYFPVAGRMEAIEVRKGSSQVKYGPRTIGGAVNLVSSSVPEDRRWFLDVATGEDRSFKLYGRVGDGSGRFGWLVEAYRLQTDGYKTLQGGGPTGFDISDLMAKIRYRSAEGARTFQQVELKAGYTDQLSNETYLGLTQSDFARTPLLRYAASQSDVLNARHRQLQARWFIRPAGLFDVTTTAYFNGFERNWYKLQSAVGLGISEVLASPDSYAGALAVLRGADSDDDALNVRANNRDYDSRGLQTVVGFELGTGSLDHQVEMGLRLHRDSEDRFQHEDGYRMENGRMVLTSEGAPGSQSNRVAEADAFSFYLEDQIRVGRWTLSPGVRFETVDFVREDYARDDPARTAPERTRANGVSAWIPGLGASFDLTPATHLFAGVHRGFGPPGPGASTDARPEESVNYEFGARARSRGVALQATLFYSDYTNILGKATLATGENGQGGLHNGGAVEVAGLEASADYDLAWGRGLAVRLPVRASYTFTHAAFRSTFESGYEPWGAVSAGDRLPYLPRHQYSGAAGIEGDRWGLTLSLFGQTAMRTRAGQGAVPEGEGTDGFTVLSLSGEIELPTGGTLYASVQNLADRRYVVARRPAGARPGLPRTLMLGVRLGN